MPKKLDPTLVEILSQYGESASDALWDCHGTWVVYHKAVERIAAKAGVAFDMPQIIEANSSAKTVAIAVRGIMGDRTEWSFGEAAPSNNKNAYPYAMAEKRAKDRVVLKLVGLHGLAYSEEESDDFKPGAAPPRKSSASLKREDVWPEFERELAETTLVTLPKFVEAWAHIMERDAWPRAWCDAAKEAVSKHKDELRNLPPETDPFPGDLPNPTAPDVKNNKYAQAYGGG